MPGKEKMSTQGAILHPPRETIFPVETGLRTTGAQPEAPGFTGISFHLVSNAQGICTGNTGQLPRCQNLSHSMEPVSNLNRTFLSTVRPAFCKRGKGWFKERLTSTLPGHCWSVAQSHPFQNDRLPKQRSGSA